MLGQANCIINNYLPRRVCSKLLFWTKKGEN
jgi:hypothetical protein